jgi:3-oxoacyl-[acyl-carrier protein] reductase
LIGPLRCIASNVAATMALLEQRELGPHKITVNAVAPGFVRIDMTERGRGAGDWQRTEESFAAKAMMRRIGQPEDIANAVAFLSCAGLPRAVT